MATADVNRLIRQISTYITNPTDISNIERAYTYAKEKHEGQLRKSGDEYIVHPLDVALILSEYQTDPTTIMAGLLHDVIEDTSATFQDVKKEFG